MKTCVKSISRLGFLIVQGFALFATANLITGCGNKSDFTAEKNKCTESSGTWNSQTNKCDPASAGTPGQPDYAGAPETTTDDAGNKVVSVESKNYQLKFYNDDQKKGFDFIYKNTPSHYLFTGFGLNIPDTIATYSNKCWWVVNPKEDADHVNGSGSGPRATRSRGKVIKLSFHLLSLDNGSAEFKLQMRNGESSTLGFSSGSVYKKLEAVAADARSDAELRVICTAGFNTALTEGNEPNWGDDSVYTLTGNGLQFLMNSYTKEGDDNKKVLTGFGKQGDAQKFAVFIQNLASNLYSSS
ncbi:MAG: hypothetical protein OXC40_05645 [Proteobacteria bacterium]|nr:hypothetical protein [Pseudomonadota bacterium]